MDSIAPDQGAEPIRIAARLMPATRIKAMTLRMEKRRMAPPGSCLTPAVGAVLITRANTERLLSHQAQAGTISQPPPWLRALNDWIAHSAGLAGPPRPPPACPAGEDVPQLTRLR